MSFIRVMGAFLVFAVIAVVAVAPPTALITWGTCLVLVNHSGWGVVAIIAGLLCAAGEVALYDRWENYR